MPDAPYLLVSEHNSEIPVEFDGFSRDHILVDLQSLDIFFISSFVVAIVTAFLKSQSLCSSLKTRGSENVLRSSWGICWGVVEPIYL